MISKIFDLLDDWRNLPAYQLERRADIFFAVYLEKILMKKLNAVFDVIIPEFPLRVGNISESHSDINKSFKIDYVAYSGSEKRVVLIELKTDQGSRREKQDWYLEKAKEIGVSGMVDGLIKIYNATDYKKKYDYLIRKIEKIGWLHIENGNHINNNVNISPQILYIQPRNNEAEKNGIVISFFEIREYLSESNDELTKRFCESLKRWEINPND